MRIEVGFLVVAEFINTSYNNMRYYILFIFFLHVSLGINAQNKKVIPGAERTAVYFPLLAGKKVAVFANQTSMVGKTHLVDTLLNSKINVVKIFGPEHGFRGTADAGEHVNNAVDTKTGLPVISLYGNHKKPTADDLKDVDVMIFDIQDVGVRYYTFISSLEYYLEAAYENQKTIIVLDRPNPNGHYVDGPVLDMKYKSFVGMQPIPTVYGMTMGEYAYMLSHYKKENENDLAIGINNANGFLEIKADNEVKQRYEIEYADNTTTHADPGNHLVIVLCKNYTHQTKYTLPIAPSPNLKQMQSIYWYPSTCYFEGTVLSEGRGTDYPFQIFGHPSYSKKLFAFTPNPNAGAKSSKLFGKPCYGWNITGTEAEVLKKVNNQIQLKYLIEAYKQFSKKDSFFITPKENKPENYFFNKLAGNATLMQQLKQGKTEAQIRNSWKADLDKFKAIRKKYLLYS
jgi:uncharacterized protein YbbC (DUF1343 family)